MTTSSSMKISIYDASQVGDVKCELHDECVSVDEIVYDQDLGIWAIPFGSHSEPQKVWGITIGELGHYYPRNCLLVVTDVSGSSGLSVPSLEKRWTCGFPIWR